MTTKPTLEQLTRKYFWEQKREEIAFVLFMLFCIWSIAGLFFQLGWQNRCDGYYYVCGNFDYEPSLPYWMMISGIVTTTFWLGVAFVCWIKRNLRKAEDRAKKELYRLKYKNKNKKK